MCGFDADKRPCFPGCFKESFQLPQLQLLIKPIVNSSKCEEYRKVPEKQTAPDTVKQQWNDSSTLKARRVVQLLAVKVQKQQYHRWRFGKSRFSVRASRWCKFAAVGGGGCPWWGNIVRRGQTTIDRNDDDTDMTPASVAWKFTWCHVLSKNDCNLWPQPWAPPTVGNARCCPPAPLCSGWG